MPSEPTPERTDAGGPKGPQGDAAPAPPDAPLPAEWPARRRAAGESRFRQRPPVWTALLTGVFAIGVFAATDGVLRVLADPSPPSTPAGAGGSLPGGGAPPTAPSGGTGAPANPATPTPGPSSGASPPASAPGAGNAPPAGAPAKPGAANDSAADDTNVDEAAEGPRRAAPPKPSDEEAPEFRESADNNISLPVDI